VEDRRGVPSRLMRSLLSLRVGAFLSWVDDGLVVVGAGPGGVWVFAEVEGFFFFGLFATVAHVAIGAAGGGLEVVGSGGGAGVDPGFGAGEGEGGVSFVCSLRSRISLFSISIWEKRRSVLVV
jgi:hypothetical protein